MLNFIKGYSIEESEISKYLEYGLLVSSKVPNDRCAKVQSDVFSGEARVLLSVSCILNILLIHLTLNFTS